MAAVPIKVVNLSPNPLPAYATEGSAGMDIRAHMEGPMQLKPLQRELVPTGLYLEIPPGYEVQIRPRSGIAINYGITCLNTPGTIDSDYRGEIKIILINLSGEAQSIYPGDRIAQMVVQKVERASLVPVTELSETERSTGGFGSTGKQ
jgi:dUTP pyrophosphatase